MYLSESLLNAPDARPTCCLNNNFKRMSHCISDYSDLTPLNRDKVRSNTIHVARKTKENSIIAEYFMTHIVYDRSKY